MRDLTAYREVARSLDVDAVALVPGPNFERAFGRSFAVNERPLIVVIPADGAPAAVVPHHELAGFADLVFAGEVFSWRDEAGYQNAFDALLQHLPVASLAVEGQTMRVFVHHALMAARPALRIVDGEAALSGLRVLKSDAELAALQQAIDISERALQRTLGELRLGQSELDIARLLTGLLFEEGADGLAFGPLVGAGEGSAKPHTVARADRAIRAGDVLLIDFGARKNGFAADITRTVFIGHASAEAQAVYATVLEANRRGQEAARPGATAAAVDDAAMRVLEASPFAARIRHKTGHGLGRAVHEAPYIMRGNETVLRPGMVFTIEPGLYEIGNFGVRIEDDVVVTETGCRSLTSFTRELTVVPA